MGEFDNHHIKKHVCFGFYLKKQKKQQQYF